MSRFLVSVDQAKVTHYLLDLTSKRGASKAKFFLARRFTLDDWMTLVTALARHALDCSPGHVSHTGYGPKHVLVGPISCPDGSSPNIKSVWMCPPEGRVVSFVTAYPGK